MSFRFPAAHRTACGVAMCMLERVERDTVAHTFDEVSVFLRTATVCSCADTSSIVFGRLDSMRL